MNRLIIVFLFLSTNIYSQQYITKEGRISFFSSTLIEDIVAVNNQVSAVYDLSSQEIAFSLDIVDFIFPIPLMQEHFNENYLESDIYPRATFTGRVISKKDSTLTIKGLLNIHGQERQIIADGLFNNKERSIFMSSTFSVKLTDYNIKIPKIVMYKIAEEIQIEVEVNLNEIR